MHLSDLHMGEVLLNTRTRLLSGFRCHDVSFAKGLFTAISTVKAFLNFQPHEHLHFIVSGDMTSIGLPGEFYVARCYLHSRLPDNWDTLRPSTGLNLALTDVHAVPGNHDHWYKGFPYTWSKGYSPELFPMHFKTSPWYHPIPSSDGGFTFNLIGIDSNSGHKSGLVGRHPRAGGKLSQTEMQHIVSHLETIPKPNRRLSVIVCHHSLVGIGGASSLAAKPLDPASAAHLVKIMKDFDVPAILTGHHHSHDVIRHGTNQKPIWEMRSPSTLVRPSKLINPGFMVHEISPELPGSQFRWKSHLFSWTNDEGRFCPASTDWFSFPF